MPSVTGANDRDAPTSSLRCPLLLQLTSYPNVSRTSYCTSRLVRLLPAKSGHVLQRDPTSLSFISLCDLQLPPENLSAILTTRLTMLGAFSVCRLVLRVYAASFPVLRTARDCLRKLVLHINYCRKMFPSLSRQLCERSYCHV